jgi:hypothetical protein
MKKTKTQSHATVPVTVVQVIVTSCISVQLLYTDCYLSLCLKNQIKSKNIFTVSSCLLFTRRVVPWSVQISVQIT